MAYKTLGNIANLVRCNSCVYMDEQKHKHEQAKTSAMVMKQDNTSTTILTTSDQLAAESTCTDTGKQQQQHDQTKALAMVMTPILTVRI